MNFFKKRKAAKQQQQQHQQQQQRHDDDDDIACHREPTRINGSTSADHNGIGFVDDDLHAHSSPRFDLSFPAATILPSFPSRSRLCKSLDETLNDDAALGHFLHFMESQGVAHLVRFWLDAQSFRITAKSRLRSELNNAQPKGAKNSAGTNERISSAASPTEEESAEKDDDSSSFSRENRDNASVEAALALSKASTVEQPNKASECDGGGDGEEGGKSGVSSYSSQKEVINDGSIDPSHSPSPPSTLSSPPTDVLSDKTKPISPLKLIEKDAVFIYQKYICPDVSNRIEMTEDAYNSIVTRICCEDGRVDPNCFVDAQSTVFEEIRQRRFPEYRQSEHHLKYQINLLTGAKLTLSDILYHENALVHFMEYVEIEGGLPLIQFWLLVENFTKLLPGASSASSSSCSNKDDSALSSIDSSGGGSLGNDDVNVYDGVQSGPSEEDLLAQKDAMVIYDKYFSLQATEALGFGDEVRFMVESNICTEDGKVDAQCFDVPVKLVLNLIAKEYLQPFLRSSICYRWLSDLINSRRLGGIPSGVRPRSGSDASSSEASVASSSQATGTKSRGKKREKKSVHDMLGESRIDVDDPDSIWRRKHNAGKLTFGKIDLMGDYRSELAFHPDTLKKKGSSRITKALKSLVQDESEIRAREDMAAQIAQMVINDVTSLTMGKPAFDLEQEKDDDDDATDDENDDEEDQR